MGRTVLAVIIIAAAFAADAGGATYQWTDDRGVIGFTDDLANVPARYRGRVRVREDITTRNPRIRQELLEQERRLLRQERSAPGGVLAPKPEAPSAFRTEGELRRETPDGSSPPGRTKSQRIEDNIERRRLWEQ